MIVSIIWSSRQFRSNLAALSLSNLFVCEKSSSCWVWKKRKVSVLIMPTLIRMPKEHQRQVQHAQQAKNGFQLGCFRICTCMHPGFVMSKSGMLKVFEILLGSCLETLLINFGAREMSATAFQSCLTTVSACLSTTFILCLCYTLSAKSFYLIRQSMFVSIPFIVSDNVVIWCIFRRSFFSTPWHVSSTQAPPATWVSCQNFQPTGIFSCSASTIWTQRCRAFT